jgi:hypothetical protein
MRVISAQTCVSLGAVMCRASPRTALKVSGQDYCIIYMQVSVADRYIFATDSCIAPSSSPFTRTCPVTAGAFDAIPSGGIYSSSSLHTSTSCVNWTVPRPVLSRVRVNLLPTYSASSPSRLHVNTSSRSHWTCSTIAGSPRIMTSLTQATSKTSTFSTHAKYGHGSARDCLYLIFLTC